MKEFNLLFHPETDEEIRQNQRHLIVARNGGALVPAPSSGDLAADIHFRIFRKGSGTKNYPSKIVNNH